MASAAIALGLLFAPQLTGSAAAAPPVEISGRYTTVLTGGTMPEGPGNAAFFEFSNAVTLSGSFNATGTANYRCVQVDAKFFRCQGEQVVTGTAPGIIDGVGTTTSRALLVCEFTTGRCSATSVSISGTGAFSDVHAVTRSQSVLGVPGGTYSGRLVISGG
ncbi:hypothetical protein ACI79J_05800 [Geodermatophilus sp. SYSU D01062]